MCVFACTILFSDIIFRASRSPARFPNALQERRRRLKPSASHLHRQSHGAEEGHEGAPQGQARGVQGRGKIYVGAFREDEQTSRAIIQIACQIGRSPKVNCLNGNCLKICI